MTPGRQPVVQMPNQLRITPNIALLPWGLPDPQSAHRHGDLRRLPCLMCPGSHALNHQESALYAEPTNAALSAYDWPKETIHTLAHAFVPVVFRPVSRADSIASIRGTTPLLFIQALQLSSGNRCIVLNPQPLADLQRLAVPALGRFEVPPLLGHYAELVVGAGRAVLDCPAAR